MPAFRMIGQRGGPAGLVNASDLLVTGGPDTDNILAISGPTSVPVGQLVKGYLIFTVGNDDAILPSANDIYNAIIGGGTDPDLEAGMGFVVTFINLAGDPTVLTSSTDGSTVCGGPASYWEGTIPANSGMDVFFKFTSIQRPTSVVAQLTNGSGAATLKFSNPSQTGAPMGPSPLAINLSPGAWIGANATYLVNGASIDLLTYGPAGLTGFQMSVSSAATGTAGLTIGPKIEAVPLRVFGAPTPIP